MQLFLFLVATDGKRRIIQHARATMAYHDKGRQGGGGAAKEIRGNLLFLFGNKKKREQQESFPFQVHDRANQISVSK